MARAACLALLWPWLSACADEPTPGRGETGLEALTLTRVVPETIVPGTVLVLEGGSFLDQPLAVSHLRLTGDVSGTPIDIELPATFVDYDEMRIEMTQANLAKLSSKLGVADGDFTGVAAVTVDFLPDGSRHASPPIAVDLQVRESLAPVLDDAQHGGEIHVNEPIAVAGGGFLLGGDEGTTVAIVEGCFRPASATECAPVDPVEVPVVPATPFDRTAGAFAFSPRIAGIFPGSFTGSLSLQNVAASGAIERSESQPIDYELVPTEVVSASSSTGTGASLGQFVDIEGGGFVGGTDGLTTMRFEGDYTLHAGGTPLAVDLELVPAFVDGRLVRYVINEDDGLGQAIDVRVDSGIFDGVVTPRITFGGDELVGMPSPLSFEILPVRQVVWVRFQASYVEGLRAFGLRALDQEIRARIFDVLRRDYATINIEFRSDEPLDYELYAIIDIAGVDPNGRGLFGLDNTPGKDVDNQRLYDRIGGVNALTQADGFDGFGGVFMESLFVFSKHPPGGGADAVAVGLFDEIFDPVRPDRGDPIAASDLADGPIPTLTSGADCPSDERTMRAACAVWVLGSLVGTTTSHELGHSLGLANPLGIEPHDLGDAPNRLMDRGGARTFEERAELSGAGPGVFCDDEYEYLREILPTTAPATTFERPYC